MEQNKNPQMNIYGQMIFSNTSKIIQWEKDTFTNPLYVENWIPTCKRIKVDPYTIYKKLTQNGTKI